MEAAPGSEDFEQAILTSIHERGHLEDTWALSEERGWEHQALVGALKSLESDGYVVSETISYKYWELTGEGQTVVAEGSPEAKVFAHTPEEGAPMDDVQRAVGPMFNVGFAQCMKNRWVAKDKATGFLRRVPGAVMRDELRDTLQRIQDAGGSLDVLSEADGAALKKRKMLMLITRKSFRVAKGPKFAPQRVRMAADLTKEMLDSGEWRTLSFKDCNLAARGKEVGGGSLHPLMAVRTEFRKILLEMGFEEMPTSQFVESSFWNFDALFQPQSHPARDAHDTFFIQDPAATLEVPEEYLRRVADIHSRGGYGSIGYGYEWKREEAMKNLLRTHTTAVSAKMLYALGQEYTRTGTFTPKKYFSIDRVFRNETLDATHLAEFHQVEFFVADRDLSLGHLIGLLQTFFAKIGITQLRFKPAYNPYTEPSMEIFGFHPDLRKWTEIGNSGIFRPEMLLPMGLPEDVKVIAGGLSLERPTMIKFGVSNIRELFGHSIDLQKNFVAPLVRF